VRLHQNSPAGAQPFQARVSERDSRSERPGAQAIAAAPVMEDWCRGSPLPAAFKVASS
jgi:hypothetical protein